MDRASIVYNPIARNAPSRDRLLAAGAVMKLRGWEVDILQTEAAMHGRELARAAAAAGSSVVFACGGDGTVNEVVNGLVGSGAALGILRAGTGNVFGKEVRVPRRLEMALEALVKGHTYRFDLGFAEGEAVEGGLPMSPGASRRYFLVMAGVGFDGAVVRRVPPRPKRLLGTASYVIWGAAEALRFRGRRARVSFDARQVESDLYWLLLANTRSYGGVADVASHALADDGLLDAYLFSGRGLSWLVRLGARIALRRHEGSAGVSFARAKLVRVETPGFEVQADGEYFGPTPISFDVARQALPVLLMPGAPERILANQPPPA